MTLQERWAQLYIARMFTRKIVGLPQHSDACDVCEAKSDWFYLGLCLVCWLAWKKILLEGVVG
jgi:hypothetical protein